ncbi:hypothetical protein [Nocardia alba]|uniref:Uncharacterized protein n=1 Tax=Nocardia alba TaxID=225051 RepID=A0A4R1FGE3_9NOCA|nr:hypothetical protein [Nocardia alba]TCJ89891.1 hypothetical protein DFR71_6180 [Nocardia alba]
MTGRNTATRDTWRKVRRVIDTIATYVGPGLLAMGLTHMYVDASLAAFLREQAHARSRGPRSVP